MTDTIRICGVVPAKGSSMRTPSKNRQQILGVPLFLWAANNLSRVIPRRDVFVDSDHPDILSEAARAGFSTIVRPGELATNAADGNALMHWAAQNVDCEILVQHMATMPFLRPSTLRRAIEAVKSDAESAVGMIEEPLYLWTDSGPTYDRSHVPNSFTLQPTRVEGMGLYVARRKSVMETGLRFPGMVASVHLDRFEAIDIDTPHDLEFARTVARGLASDSELLVGLTELRAQNEACA